MSPITKQRLRDAERLMDRIPADEWVELYGADLVASCKRPGSPRRGAGRDAPERLGLLLASGMMFYQTVVFALVAFDARRKKGEGEPAGDALFDTCIKASVGFARTTGAGILREPMDGIEKALDEVAAAFGPDASRQIEGLRKMFRDTIAVSRSFADVDADQAPN